MTFKDGATDLDEAPVPAAKVATVGGYGGLAIMAVMSDGSGQWRPRFEAEPLSRTDGIGFDAWWMASALSNRYDLDMSRKNIILWTANRDGGTHVGVEGLPSAFRRVSREAELGWSTATGDVLSSPTEPVVRHIAEEVRTSIREHFRAELGDLPAPEHVPPPAGLMFISDLIFMVHDET